MAEAQYAHNHTIDPITGYTENKAYISQFSPDRKKAFLEHFLTNGMGLYRTCRALGLSTDTVNKHYQTDPIFRADFDEARKEYTDELEATSRANALNPRSVIERIFQLKALVPEKYGDKRDSCAVNVTINFDEKVLDSIRKRQEVIDIEPISDLKIESK